MESQVFHDTTTLSVARIGEEITFKRYYRQNGYGSLELQPVSSNTDHSTIHLDGQNDFEISGAVVGLSSALGWTGSLVIHL